MNLFVFIFNAVERSKCFKRNNCDFWRLVLIVVFVVIFIFFLLFTPLVDAILDHVGHAFSPFVLVRFRHSSLLDGSFCRFGWRPCSRSLGRALLHLFHLHIRGVLLIARALVSVARVGILGIIVLRVFEVLALFGCARNANGTSTRLVSHRRRGGGSFTNSHWENRV